MQAARKKLGLIVNPIAGMGGRVGLKGTNGRDTLKRAISLGAKPVSPGRAVEALKKLSPLRGEIQLITYPREMGEDEAREAGFFPEVMGKITPGQTTAEDTVKAAREMREKGVDLILAAGGDGTMGDIIGAVGTSVPILGIPAGVKLHSACFANTPEAAGMIAARFLREGLPLREVEVMDIDEDSYREGRLSARLKGFALTPYEPTMVQSTKEGSSGLDLADQRAIARWVFELMEPDCTYILGPGTTTRAVAEELGIKNSTLLGVDIVKNYKLVARDVNEEQILREIEGKKAVIIVSPIGRQGFIFGRGNQQISPRVIELVGKENIWVLATPQKLKLTPVLKVDTGDSDLDRRLRGYFRVITGYREMRMVKVE